MRKQLSGLIIATILLIPAVGMAAPWAKAEGKPDLPASMERGAGIWHDASGTHVRFTTKGKTHKFYGKICTPGGKVTGITKVRVEAADKVEVGPKGNCVIFSVNNTGGVDGFDFQSNSPKLDVEINIDDHPLLPKFIFIGKKQLNPKKNPFKIK